MSVSLTTYTYYTYTAYIICISTFLNLNSEIGRFWKVTAKNQFLRIKNCSATMRNAMSFVNVSL